MSLVASEKVSTKSFAVSDNMTPVQYLQSRYEEEANLERSQQLAKCSRR